MMVEKINNNGYDFVDLGLPSGTLWATCNVGADKPSDSGLYFQWGDVQGYTFCQVGLGDGQKKFSSDFSDYKWHESGIVDVDNIKFKKYTVGGAALKLEDDAVHTHMGGDWHMPTISQIKELIDNTTSEWTEQNGVKGKLLISKSDTSKTIFFPAAGIAWDGSVRYSGVDGYVWSSMLDVTYVDSGQSLLFYSGYVNLFSDDRYNGLPVRGIIG